MLPSGSCIWRNRSAISRTAVATSLRTGRSHLIGVLLPDIANPVFAPILSGIAEALASESYAPIVADAATTPRSRSRLSTNLLTSAVDG